MPCKFPQNIATVLLCSQGQQTHIAGQIESTYETYIVWDSETTALFLPWFSKQKKRVFSPHLKFKLPCTFYLLSCIISWPTSQKLSCWLIVRLMNIPALLTCQVHTEDPLHEPKLTFLSLGFPYYTIDQSLRFRNLQETLISHIMNPFLLNCY